MEEAEDYYQKSLTLNTQKFGEGHLENATTLNNLGMLNMELGKYELAESYLSEALFIREKNKHIGDLNYGDILMNLGILYSLQNKDQLAQDYLTRGIRNFRHLLQKNYPVLSEREKLLFLKRTVELNFALFYSYIWDNEGNAAELCQEAMNLSLSTKLLGRAVSDKIRSTIIDSGDEELLTVFEELTKMRLQIAKYALIDQENLALLGISLASFEAKADSLEKVLSYNAQDFAPSWNAMDYNWQDLQQQLAQEDVAISFIHFNYLGEEDYSDDDFYAALILRTNDSSPIWIRLCTGKDIRKFLNYKDASEDNAYIQDAEVAHLLYQQIWNPIAPYLQGKKNIHFAPSGLLNHISIQLLVSENGERLIERYQLYQYSSLRDYVKQKTNDKHEYDKSITIFGNPDFDYLIEEATKSLTTKSPVFTIPPKMEQDIYAWRALNYTKTEVEQTSQQFQQAGWLVQPYLDHLASESHFKALSGRPPRIIHLATHGFFFPNPRRDSRTQPRLQNLKGSNAINISLTDQPLLRSGLILAGANYTWQNGAIPIGQEDGILTAYEIVNLDLRKTELVILSACDTGLGDIESTEGVFGLQRAFKQAGVDKLIMSLWKIPDLETVLFIETFYDHYLKGSSIREAFTKTQREMSQQYPPYYWAGFVLVE